MKKSKKAKKAKSPARKVETKTAVAHMEKSISPAVYIPVIVLVAVVVLAYVVSTGYPAR